MNKFDDINKFDKQVSTSGCYGCYFKNDDRNQYEQCDLLKFIKSWPCVGKDTTYIFKFNISKTLNQL